jgi:hypothetical protein
LSLFFVVHVLQVLRAGWGNVRSMVTGYVIEHRPHTSAAVAESDDAEPVDDRAEEVSR